ncbi:iron dicitrate transport regulator FecR [Xenophilus aerolatus]|nr:iron dicitrate transport regulator FecR [Xenophilus aerolatus]
MSGARLRGLLRRVVAGGLLLAAAAGPACAQARAPSAPAAGQGGYTTHQVSPGETLATIGARYLREPRQWRQLQRLNGIDDPDALAPGSTVRIPARLLKPSALGARVEFVRGQGVVSQAGGAQRPDAAPAPVIPGASLTEGTRIQVPEDGYLRLRLADGSIVRVLAGSDVELKRLRRRNNAASFESVVDVKKGKVESEVSKQPAGRVFEIHAPGAVASVRGTRFDVSVAEDGRVGTAVSEGEVALRAQAPSRRAKARTARLGPGQGVVVRAGGQLGSRRVLPAAPELGALAETYEDASIMRLDLGALAGDHEVRIARDPAFQEVLRNGVAHGGRLDLPTLEDGIYTVGVRALDADGLAGAEAQRRIRVHARPVPPLYQYPPPGGRVTAEGAQLVCSEVAGVAWVHVQVASRADFTAPEIDEPRLARCRVGLGALAPGEYHWRVASVRDDGTAAGDHGPFAPAQRFSVVAAPRIDQVEVVDAGENPTLHWAAAPGQTFRGQVASEPTFQRIVLEADLKQAQWTLSGLPRGLYYVRLQALDAGGLVGPWAPARRVQVGGMLQSGSGGRVTSSDGEPVLRP